MSVCEVLQQLFLQCKGFPLPWKNPTTADCDTTKLYETTEGVFDSKTSVTTFLCNITKLGERGWDNYNVLRICTAGASA